MSEDNEFISEEEADAIKRRARDHGGTGILYTVKCESCGSWNTASHIASDECLTCGYEKSYRQ